MKNLNELGVQEMDAKELKKTDGGAEIMRIGNCYYEVWWQNGKRYARLISCVA